jgi:hypothetical protein
MGLEDSLAAMSPDGTGGDARQMRLPKKSIQSEYLMSILMVERSFDQVLVDLKRVDDPRPRVLARQIINRVLDDPIRYSIIDSFNANIDKINNAPGTSEEKALNIISLSQDTVGEVNSYLDEYFALHKGQEIGDV